MGLSRNYDKLSKAKTGSFCILCVQTTFEDKKAHQTPPLSQGFCMMMVSDFTLICITRPALTQAWRKEEMPPPSAALLWLCPLGCQTAPQMLPRTLGAHTAVLRQALNKSYSKKNI